VPQRRRRRYELTLRDASGMPRELLRAAHSVSGGMTGVRLLASRLEESTLAAYGRHWQAFVDYCSSEALDSLPATSRTVLFYLGHLAEKGTVAASSLQPYLSAINGAHRDHGFDPPALGHMVAGARQGMGRAQAATRTTDARIPLPASAFESVLSAGLELAAQPATEAGGAKARAQGLRRAYAFALCALFVGRQDSAVHLRARDHGIDDSFIWLRLTEKMKRGRALRRIVRLPLSAGTARGHESALPSVARLGRAYIDAREQLGGQGDWLFQLPGERRPDTRAMEAWVARLLRDGGIRAPPGFAYLGHSIRSGAASACSAIDVRRHILCWMGGWAPGSATLEHHYLDPSVTPSPAAYAFYGWLLRGEYEMGMPAWVDAARARVVDDVGEYF
jgi:hypothetical protein